MPQFSFEDYLFETRQEVLVRLRRAGTKYSEGLNEVWHLLGDKRPVYADMGGRGTIRVFGTYEVGGEKFTAPGSGSSRSQARSQAARSIMEKMGIMRALAEANRSHELGHGQEPRLRTRPDSTGQYGEIAAAS